MKTTPEITAASLAALSADWLPGQRWFAGKQRTIAGVRLVHATTLSQGADAADTTGAAVATAIATQNFPPPAEDSSDSAEPRLEHLVVEVEYADRRSVELYQLLIGVRPELPRRLEYAEIGRIDTVDGPAFVYDAVHDPQATNVLLNLLANDAKVGDLTFAREPGAHVKTHLHSRPVQAEQSHTSIVFGESYILKLFRRLHYGVSPDVELHRALRETGSIHVAQPFAAFEGLLPHDVAPPHSVVEPTTFGLLQEFFHNSAEGWGMAVASVRDLISEADERADRAGGDFAAESHRLGQAVATVHSELAEALGTDEVDATELVAEMLARAESVSSRVDELAPHRSRIREIFTGLAELSEPVRVQRIHGDLHLGQTMRTLNRWVLIDFEGEPARSLADRRRPASPLQDVAGMLRSFDYAAHHLLLNWEGDAELQERGSQWVRRNRQAFIDGYSSVEGTNLVEPRKHPILLRALELDKAIYEVAYELNHRPSWTPIPLGSVARLTA